MEVHLKSADGEDIYETGVASFVCTDSGVTVLYEETSGVASILTAKKEHFEGAEIARGGIEGEGSYEQQADDTQNLQKISEKVQRLIDAGKVEEEWLTQERINELMDDQQKRRRFLNREV